MLFRSSDWQIYLFSLMLTWRMSYFLLKLVLRCICRFCWGINIKEGLESTGGDPDGPLSASSRTSLYESTKMSLINQNKL